MFNFSSSSWFVILILVVVTILNVKLSKGNKYCLLKVNLTSNSDKPIGKFVNTKTKLFKPVYFVSSPGTGSRWIHTLVQSALGARRIISYRQQKLLLNYNVTLCLDNQGIQHKGTKIPEIIIKLQVPWIKGPKSASSSDIYQRQSFPNDFMNDTTQSLVLIRNPYNSLISWVTHTHAGTGYFTTKSWNNIAEAIKKNPQRFNKLFLTRSKHFTWLYTTWLSKQHVQKPRIIFYEDFLNEPKQELKKLLSYANISTQVEERIIGAIEDAKISSLTYKRKKLSEEGKLFLQKYFEYNKVLMNQINHGLVRIEKLLKKLGYDDRILTETYKNYY